MTEAAFLAPPRRSRSSGPGTVGSRRPPRAWAHDSGCSRRGKNPVMVVETLAVVDEVEGPDRRPDAVPIAQEDHHRRGAPDRARPGRLAPPQRDRTRVRIHLSTHGRLGERKTARRRKDCPRGVLRASGEQFEFNHDSSGKGEYEQLLARAAIPSPGRRRSWKRSTAETARAHERLAYPTPTRKSHAPRPCASVYHRFAEGARGECRRRPVRSLDKHHHGDRARIRVRPRAGST